jgi:hypothetical protein
MLYKYIEKKFVILFFLYSLNDNKVLLILVDNNFLSAGLML